jgi:hypothetical protein
MLDSSVCNDSISGFVTVSLTAKLCDLKQDKRKENALDTSEKKNIFIYIIK